MAPVNDLVLSLCPYEAWMNTADAPINKFPDIVLVKIFSYFNAEELLLVVRRVCKRWLILCWNTDVWKGKTLDTWSPNHPITDAILSATLQFTGKLTGLIIDDTRETVSSHGVASALKFAECLKNLQLEGDDCLDVKVFKAVATHCQKLEELFLYTRYDFISSSCFEHLKANTNLHTLRIGTGHCMADEPHYGNADIASMAKNCPRLKHLHLQGCFLKDVWFKAMGDASFTLKIFHLNCTYEAIGFTAAGMKQIAKMSSLEELKLEYISDTKWRSDDVFKTIAIGCSRLRTLCIRCCRGVSDDDVFHVAANLKDLRHLHLENLFDITDVAIQHISKYCKNLQVLKFGSMSDEAEACVPLLLCKSSALRVTLLELVLSNQFEEIPEKYYKALVKCYPFVKINYSLYMSF